VKAIQIPDRTRASLAPYLPIPYGELKFAGMVTSLVLFLIAQAAAHLWFPSYGWPTNLGILISGLFMIIFLLIAAVASRDVDGGWAAAYWDRNWRGYTLWVYKEGEEYKYWVFRTGDLANHGVEVCISIPLYKLAGVPTYWVRDTLVPTQFHLQLKHRTFSGAWCVVVGDSFGNRLTLPVEMALELGLAQIQDTSELPYTARHFDLANNFLAVCKDWKWQNEARASNHRRFEDSLRVIEKAIEMIRASKRFQHSAEGKRIREFLELRYLMIANNESEGEARKRMAKSA